VGRTTQLEINRQEFYQVGYVVKEVERRLSECEELNQKVDYLTLVPDGEPTLDVNIGALIKQLQKFQLPIAVISNAALIDRGDVQDSLMAADWVSLKIDTLDEAKWHKINRPHKQLSLTSILTGILEFRLRFSGELVTETMLISGINDGEADVHQLATFLLELQPFKSYLSIPTRPPSEAWVQAPAPENLQVLLSILSERIPFMDILFEAEPSDFVSTGDLAEDILAITAVHPLREDALKDLLKRSGEDWGVVDQLIASKKLICIQYRDERFYLRGKPERSST